MDTVFSHIIQKHFSGVSEDVATDALAYIMHSSAPARRGMVNLLRVCAAGLPDLTFRTQQMEGSLRPDMWGYAGTEPRVYIENKFWAGLTDNQPTAYLQQLAAYGHPTVLLFIAPAARERTLWRELLGRLAASGLTTSVGHPQAGVSQVVVTSAGPVMALTSWASVLAALETQCVDEPAARSDIAQLRALCDAADIEAFLPISGAALTDQRTPALMLQLSTVVQSAVDSAVTKGVLHLKGTMPQASAERIGRYAYFGKDQRGGAWIGIHFRLWRKHGGSPLWLVFSELNWCQAPLMDAVLTPWGKENEVLTVRNPDGTYAVALDIPAGEEQSVVVQAIVARLEAIYRQLPVREVPCELPPEDAVFSEPEG